MREGANQEFALSDGGRAAASFFEFVAAQHFEAVSDGDRVNGAALVNDEDGVTITDRGTEDLAVSFRSLAPEILPGGRIDEGDNAAVLPEVETVADSDDTRDVRHGALDAPDFFEGVVSGQTDRNTVFWVAGESAGADDEILPDDGGADGAFVLLLRKDGQLGDDTTVGGINGGVTMRPVGEDEQVLSGRRMRINNGGGVAEATAVALGLPRQVASRTVEGDQKACSLLIIVEHQ